MSKKPTSAPIQCAFFHWKLYQRQGVWYADGRSNSPRLGRYSLQTSEKERAWQQVVEVDKRLAVVHGRLDRSQLGNVNRPVPLAEGIELYLSGLDKPEIAKTVRPRTIARYQTVFRKFVTYAAHNRLVTWQQVNEDCLFAYGKFLEERVKYKRKTLTHALNTLVQVNRFLIRKKHLPESAKIELSLKRVKGTSTYCWRPEEVKAMIGHCHENQQLLWLGEVLIALATTGMRISELIRLRWSDIDFENEKILIADDLERGVNTQEIRRTKSGRSREIPVHPDLQAVLGKLPKKLNGFVFHGPQGRDLTYSTVRREFVKTVLEPLQIRFPTPPGQNKGFSNGRLHSFRHFFVSRCACEGIPELELKGWVGHTSSEMILRYYHPQHDLARSHIKRLQSVNPASNRAVAG